MLLGATSSRGWCGAAACCFAHCRLAAEHNQQHSQRHSQHSLSCHFTLTAARGRDGGLDAGPARAGGCHTSGSYGSCSCCCCCLRCSTTHHTAQQVSACSVHAAGACRALHGMRGRCCTQEASSPALACTGLLSSSEGCRNGSSSCVELCRQQRVQARQQQRVHGHLLLLPHGCIATSTQQQTHHGWRAPRG